MKNYKLEIDAITQKIETQENSNEQWILNYNRGYYYFLQNDEINAKKDYLEAITKGLDCTVYPYYIFSKTNKHRKNLILPEKIMLFLIIIMVGICLFIQVSNAIMNIKTQI